MPKSSVSLSDWKLIVLICAVSSLTSVGIAILLYNTLDVAFIENASCNSGGVWSYCFFDEGKVWDSETYTALLTNFYTTIITFLAVIISIISVVAFFVIRETARSHAEDYIEKEIQKIIQNDRLKGIVKDSITDDVLRNATSNFVHEQTRPIVHANETLSERLDTVEAALESLDVLDSSHTLGEGNA
ncbi:hypothetical protein [Thalassospira sp.]|uniref:hypothetical protein n=1 Tax=Thalassospira sp. TaxID=1912094 RepID=UPI001B0B9A22|nr:hypothetical protein [Thalassospira sp.]MBO6805521.1 hypothetical protein [Thalassospira sp.]MBO6842600.1 hypothetical protein [Thalassospira sp.]